MNTTRQQWTRAARTLGAGSIILTLTVLAAWRVWSQSAAPALSIAAATSTNELTLTVTNPVPNTTYEIWWTEFLDADAMSLTNGGWQPIGSGTNGQTVFPVVGLEDYDSGFFRAINLLDLDNDGVPNYQDVRPFDSSIGILRVTIESPANGAVVN